MDFIVKNEMRKIIKLITLLITLFIRRINYKILKLIKNPKIGNKNLNNFNFLFLSFTVVVRELEYRNYLLKE